MCGPETWKTIRTAPALRRALARLILQKPAKSAMKTWRP
jgi:hypothetical protein